MDPYLHLAIEEARRSLAEGGIPIGSVLVKGDKAIAQGHNRRVQDGDPMAHAEICCLRNAGRMSSYHSVVLYSTLMPCYLCAGAVVQFGISKVIAGESRTFSGAESLMIEHGVEVIDLDEEECYTLMQDFIKRNPKLWNEDIGEVEVSGFFEKSQEV